MLIPQALLEPLEVPLSESLSDPYLGTWTLRVWEEAITIRVLVRQRSQTYHNLIGTYSQ